MNPFLRTSYDKCYDRCGSHKCQPCYQSKCHQSKCHQEYHKQCHKKCHDQCGNRGYSIWLLQRYARERTPIPVPPTPGPATRDLRNLLELLGITLPAYVEIFVRLESGEVVIREREATNIIRSGNTANTLSVLGTQTNQIQANTDQVQTQDYVIYRFPSSLDIVACLNEVEGILGSLEDPLRYLATTRFPTSDCLYTFTELVARLQILRLAYVLGRARYPVDLEVNFVYQGNQAAVQLVLDDQVLGTFTLLTVTNLIESVLDGVYRWDVILDLVTNPTTPEAQLAVVILGFVNARNWTFQTVIAFKTIEGLLFVLGDITRYPRNLSTILVDIKGSLPDNPNSPQIHVDETTVGLSFPDVREGIQFRVDLPVLVQLLFLIGEFPGNPQTDREALRAYILVNGGPGLLETLNYLLDVIDIIKMG